ncbi:MAG TPA: carboxylating nicotinate-nucleotide diphosphorylase [Oleiagrimonas sp.]|nr:carboxylating nicotinate-nucleotide diphosphorylase [Oleiagrimonas sp.]
MSTAARAMTRTPALPPASIINDDVTRALAEDIGDGDVTAALLPATDTARAHVMCREAATIAGAAWFDACFDHIDPATRIDWHVADGERVDADTIVCSLHGNARALVTAERTAINFLQTLSGTASIAARYADAVAGTHTRILDTRKTVPGLRAAQKYAVRCGGACNHRTGLHDALLVKENHIAAAGGIDAAVHAARAQHPELLLEVEVETLAELDQAIAAGVDRIMLDEFSPETMREAVARTAGRVALEVSGSVELDRLAAIAATGVDFISVGALTKHVQAIDFSMRLQSD